VRLNHSGRADLRPFCAFRNDEVYPDAPRLGPREPRLVRLYPIRCRFLSRRIASFDQNPRRRWLGRGPVADRGISDGAISLAASWLVTPTGVALTWLLDERSALFSTD